MSVVIEAQPMMAETEVVRIGVIAGNAVPRLTIRKAQTVGASVLRSFIRNVQNSLSAVAPDVAVVGGAAAG